MEACELNEMADNRRHVFLVRLSKKHPKKRHLRLFESSLHEMGRLISFELFVLKILFLVLNFVICFSFNVPEGLISLLENFSLKADEKAEDA